MRAETDTNRRQHPLHGAKRPGFPSYRQAGNPASTSRLPRSPQQTPALQFLYVADPSSDYRRVHLTAVRFPR